MKNKTIALIGVGSYLLSVITSATDNNGNFLLPSFLIGISGIAEILFLYMASRRLWRDARQVSIALIVAAIASSALTAIRELTASESLIVWNNMGRVFYLITFFWAVIQLFNSKEVHGNKTQVATQQDEAKELYEKNPGLAMQIALGDETATNGDLSVAVYAKVCDEVEKANDLDACMRIANSFHNSKLSSEAQRLTFRSPNSAIEKMKKVVNSRREALEKQLPAGKTVEAAIVEEANSLKKYLFFLLDYVEKLAESQTDIEEKIQRIKTKTGQNLKDAQLIRELWILRYVFCFSWFAEIKPPENQRDLEANIALITHAFENINNNPDFSSSLVNGFADYAGTDQLQFADLGKFKISVLEMIAERMPIIAFECTEGRLAGELNDFVIELIKTTIEDDKRSFLA